MGLALEILDVILRIMWSFLESVYRAIIPVARKKIDGEIVLITGGGGKIAECVAMEMAKLNVTIVLWDINEDANNKVAEKVRAKGATVHTFCCDLTDKEKVYSVAEEVKRQVGHVTILINNAGLLYGRSLMNCSDKQIIKQFEVNSLSHYWTTKAFLPHMYDMNYGHIVTIASMAGLVSLKNLIGYCGSKFAAVGFHTGLTNELRGLGKNGIKTTCICPAVVETPLISDVIYSPRFPSLSPPLKPEMVAEEIVDGMLRDKDVVVIPKHLKYILRITSVFPKRGQDILGDYLNLSFVDDNAHVPFQKLKEMQSANGDKKTE